MADIDFIINTENGFEVSLGDTPSAATGNKFLSNRFVITFLTTIKQYLYNNTMVVDSYGGDALKFVGEPQALNNIQSIATSITVAMNKTIDSIKSAQSTLLSNTEKLSSATLVDVSVIKDKVYATIQLFPIEYSSPNEIYFKVPVIGV